MEQTITNSTGSNRSGQTKPKNQKPSSVINPQELWVLIHLTYYLIRRVRENELKTSHITLTQRLLLHALHIQGGKATVNELVVRHYSDYHNVAALVKRMAHTGLINRRQSTSDERLINVELTKKGKQLWKLTEKSDEIQNIVSVFSDKEFNRFMSLLTKLYNASLQRLGTQETSRRYKL
jgi:DNA-binding MarR family transcriptional regulator